MPRSRLDGSLSGSLNYLNTNSINGVWSLNDVETGMVTNTWPADATLRDSSFNNTVLLLNGEEGEFVNNTIYVNSSTYSNLYSINVNGSPLQGSFSPFSTTGWSNYFGGADYLTLPNNMTATGSNAYTLEGWFFPTVVSSAEIPLVKLYNATQTIELRIVSSKIQGRINNSATIVGGNTTLNPYQWYHFALVKPTSGTSTAVLYINGVAETTTASDTTTYTAFTTPRIGANQTPNLYYSGWASNIRFVSGTGLYTSNFTPPTRPLSSVSNTLFLTCKDNRFKDSSSNQYAITPSGSSLATIPFSPFYPSDAYSNTSYGGSIYFNGSTDFLQSNVGSSALLFTANDDFTVEFWAYPTVQGSRQDWFDLTDPTGSGNRIIVYYDGSNFAYAADTAVAANRITSSATLYQQWYHVAACKILNSTKLFVNGTQVGSTYSDTFNYTNNLRFTSGKDPAGATLVSGHMYDIKYVKGRAIYTADFTPPTSPLITDSDAVLHLKGTNGGVIDKTGKNNLKTLGSASISQALKKFGKGSYFFDGTSKQITGISNQLLNFATGDFTVEMWIYPTFTTSASQVCLFNTGIGYFFLQFNNTTFSIGIAGSAISTSFTSTIPSNTWTHVAVSRTNSVVYGFVNGTLISSATDTSNFGQVGLWIGGLANATQLYTGYIDDIRVTRAGRYTATFPVPANAFNVR